MLIILVFTEKSEYSKQGEESKARQKKIYADTFFIDNAGLPTIFKLPIGMLTDPGDYGSRVEAGENDPERLGLAKSMLKYPLQAVSNVHLYNTHHKFNIIVFCHRRLSHLKE